MKNKIELRNLCPICKEKIESEQIKCNQCDSKLPRSEFFLLPIIIPIKNLKLCPYCKKEVKKNALKCKHCKKNLFNIN